MKNWRQVTLEQGHREIWINLDNISCMSLEPCGDGKFVTHLYLRQPVSPVNDGLLVVCDEPEKILLGLSGGG